MIHLLFTSLIILSAFLGSDCREEPVQPCTDCPQQKPDTTSHNFSVFQVDTLGDYFSSLYCNDIVGDDHIWAGGEFTRKDSNGYYLTSANLAHWDGLRWNMIAVPFLGYNNTGPSIEPIIDIKVFSDSDIVVISRFNSFARWNGIMWTSQFVDPQISYLQHLWARSSNDIYFTGEQGRSAHYNGLTFTKMNTGITNPPISDICGDDDEVFAVGHATTLSEGEDHVLLHTDNKRGWQIVQKYQPTFNNRGSMLSICKPNNASKIWMLGGKNSGSVWEIQSLYPFSANEIFNINHISLLFAPYLIRGNGDNDIFVVGKINGEIIHFNGKSWKSLGPTATDLSVQGFDSMDNTYVLVGNTFSRAVVVRGKR